MSYTKKIGRHYGNLMEKLNIQRCIGEFCDLTIIIRKERFNAHKCVLAAASKRLHNLVGRMAPTDNDVLYIDTITPQGFKIVLEYIYTSSLWIPTECLTDVSNAAMFLEMEELVQSCLAFASPQNTNTQSKDTTASYPADSSLPSHDRDFTQNTDNMAADLMNSKLPELDSSLGGFLDAHQHTPASASVSNYGDNQVDGGNKEERANYGTYPDQDALSEISAQNDPPGDDDLVYQDIANVQSSSNTDYAYHPYVPPIEQTFSPRRLPKMLHASMTLIPSMLPSHSFLQDANQYQMDGYFLSQPPQYYPSNMNLVNNYMQDQPRGSYGPNSDQAYGPNPSQGFSNVDDIDKQRPYTGYGPSSDVSSSYNQIPSGYTDMPYPEPPYEADGKIARSYSKDFADEIQSGYKTTAGQNSRSFDGDFMSSGSYLPIPNFDNSEPSSQIQSDVFEKTDHGASSQELHKNQSSSVSTRENETRKMAGHSANLPKKNLDIEKNTELSGDAPKTESHTEKIPLSTSETTGSCTAVSTSHFNSRPAARMPPKKAGYRGIESDYNREFNTGVKSNIVGQYDNLAAIGNSQSSPSKAPQTAASTVGSSSHTEKSSNRTDAFDSPQKSLENETRISSMSDTPGKQNNDSATTAHKAANEFYLTQSTDHPFFSDEVTESLKTTYDRRRRSYETQEIRKYSPNTDNRNKLNVSQDIASQPYDDLDRPSQQNASYNHAGNDENYEPPIDIQNQNTDRSVSDMQFYRADYSSGKDMANVTNSSETHKDTEHHAPLLSPISTQSMDMTEYNPSERDIGFGYNHFPNPQDGSSQFSSMPKGVNLTPSKSNIADTVYSYIEDYFRLLDPQHGQSPSKISMMSNNSVNYTPSQYSVSTPAPYTPVTSSLYVNTQNSSADTTPVYINISPTPINPQQSYASNSSINPSHNPSYSSSVEDARKTILNVLSQEKFDDVSAHNVTSSVGAESQGDREGVPLSQLYNIVPFDRAGEGTTQNTQSQHEGTGYNSALEDRETTSKFVPQFEDIDSDSGSESNYNKLVIDFDKDMHIEEAKRSDKTTQASPVKRAHQKIKTPAKKHAAEGSKIASKAEMRTFDKISPVKNNNKPKGENNKTGDQNSYRVSESSVTTDLPRDNSSNAQHNESPSKLLGSRRRKNQQPIKVPKYTITTEYKESTDNRSGTKENEIIKPLKKRIKLTLNMTKLQDDDVTVTRAKVKPKQHNRRIKYSCELCKREFWDRYKAFAEHMTAHTRDELNFCNICGLGYKRLEDLSRHRANMHALNSFDCIHCNTQFTNPTLYRKHCLNIHKETKMFRCLYDNCNFTTGRLNVLEKHTLIHGMEKQFKCPHCAREFAQPNGLRLHLLTCLNMQQHVCGQCGKSFNRIQSLREHEAIHKGDKKYVCTVCKASFTDHRNFKRHSRIHSNEMPYQCKHCGDKFRYSNVLKRHLASKHQDSVEMGKKGSKNKESVLIKNYNAQTEIACS